MSEPVAFKRCISCGKAFAHTHPGVIKGCYWACSEECNSHDDRREQKPTCFMCLREINDNMKTRCFHASGDERIYFCSVQCSRAHQRGLAGWTVCDQVVSDIHGRREMGMRSYGKGLDWNDGHDWLLEAYQEALDMCIYLKTALIKREEDARNIKRSGGPGLFAATGTDGRRTVP